MLSLKDIKKKTLGDEENKEKADLKPLEIGFKVESKFDITKRNLRKRFYIFIEELKISGFHTNFWMWNFVFLNFLAAFILFFIITRSYSNLPASIGLNIDNDWSYDITVAKNILFFVPALHIFVIFLSLALSIKSHKKLTYLYLAAFFQILVFIFFEIISIRNLIVYFT